MKKNRTELIIKAIKQAAEESGQKEFEITKGQAISTGLVTDHDFRCSPGIDAIKKKFFPFTEKDLASIQQIKKHNTYVAKLEKQLGEKIHNQEEYLEILAKTLKPLPKPIYKKAKPGKTKGERELVVMLSDTHYGLIVDGEAVGGLNQYSWTEASRRTAMVIREAIEYKPHARGLTRKVHLVLGGDHQQGIIHGMTGKGHDLMVHQQNGMTHILTQAIDALATEFDEVVVHGVSGNHSEQPHKREHGKRITGEFSDTFEHMSYYSLSVAFRNYDHVSFNFVKTPYTFIDLPAGRCMLVHGHNIFSAAIGNPGTSVNVKSLTNAIRDFNSGEVTKGNPPVKLILHGHTHCYYHLISKDGTEFFNSPSLSGIDEFAHQLNINTNFAGQVIFETTKDYMMGDSRLVRVMEADKDKSLDAIISIYNRELKWSKK